MKTLYLTADDDLQKAVNSLQEPAVVRLAAGIYNAKTLITASNVKIVGEGADKTILTYGDYAKKMHADGREYNTFRTYTLCITGDCVGLENLTVENSNVCPREVGQCVALSVHGDRFYARNVTLKSTQDTLFLAPFPDDLVTRYDGFIPENQLYREGRLSHLFENCVICGTVDFIFGCSQAYFFNCKIISLYDDRKTGFIAAPAHCLAEDRGFNFVDCDIRADGAGENEVYLARPWRDYGKCAFVGCTLGSHVKSELFDKWNDTSRDRTARFAFYGLKSEKPVAPVSWAKRLPDAEAEKIIKDCKARLKEYKNLI